MDFEKIKEFFNARDKFARHNGVEVTEVGEGWAVSRMEMRDESRNGVGIGHGGALFTLADLAFAAAAVSHGMIAVGVNSTISYLKPAKEGVITASAREVSRSRTLASYIVHVTDEAGEVLAVLQCMAYVKKEPVEV